MKQVDSDGKRALLETRGEVDRAEIEVADMLETLHKKDVALSTRKYEREQLLSEMARKKSELAHLSSARAALQSNEAEFNEARRSHDEFVESYNAKTADIKKTTKELTDQIHALTEELSTDASLLQELSFNRKEVNLLSESL